MDSGRIGKALGIGTRVFSKAVSHALETSAQSAQPVGKAAVQTTRKVANQAAEQATTTSTNLARGAGRFGEAIWGPLVRTSGVVWLETMGVLFAFVALYFAQSLWRFRADIFRPPLDKLFLHYLLYIAATGLFVYFAVSSFVRAERRSRGKK
jgi:hypothetical protein